MYAHANRYHLEEVERDWHFDPVPKLYFPKPPGLYQRDLNVIFNVMT